MPKLSEHFDGVMIKRLSEVETDPACSNQHEFNGTGEMRLHLGDERRQLPASFIYIGLDDMRVVADDSVTWYDARESHPTRSEHRLYFHDNEAIDAATAGDVLIIGLRKDRSLLILIVNASSEDLPAILWMFGAHENALDSPCAIDPASVEQESSAAFNLIADVIGIEIDRGAQGDWLDILLGRFGAKMPTTRELSKLALDTLQGELSAIDAPDETLLALMDREETLFRQLERHLVSREILQSAGQWADDVDSFMHFSLSVQNRRKSRAGHAFENHLEWILLENNILFARGATTEGRARPDFLFPGQAEYRDRNFPAQRLTMLGAKTSCKDRWRQVLTEAARIADKHLLTLQPGISASQTDEMRRARLVLVVPRPLHVTFTMAQRQWLADLRGFIRLVGNRQAKSSDS